MPLFKYEKIRKTFNPAIMEPVFSVNVLANDGCVLYSTPEGDSFNEAQANDFGREVVEYLESLGAAAFIQGEQKVAS